MVFDNWKHYTRKETVQVLRSAEMPYIAGEPSKIADRVFDSQGVTDATGVLLGAHINAIVFMSHTQGAMSRIYIGSLDCSHLTPEVMETIGGIYFDATHTVESVSETVFIIISLLSHGVDFDDIISWFDNIPWRYVFHIYKEVYYWMNKATYEHSPCVSAVMDHVGHSRLSYVVGNTSQPSNYTVGEYLSDVFASEVTVSDARDLRDRLLSIPADDAYRIIAASRSLTSKAPVEDAPESTSRELCFLERALDGYNNFSRQYSDHMVHSDNTFEPHEYSQCFETYYTFVTTGYPFAADMAMFYILSVPATYRAMVLDNVEGIIRKFIDREESLLYYSTGSALPLGLGNMTTCDGVTNPALPTHATFPPAMMSVVCEKFAHDVSVWCDMVLVLAHSAVVSFHRAETVMFVVENYHDICDLPVEWVMNLSLQR